MRTARLIFGIAGIYGLVMLTPLFFAERFLVPSPNRPEDYYGFLGAAWVMQLVYLTIARDPVPFRPLMPVCVLAKAVFFLTILWLWLSGRAAGPAMALASIDGLLGALFLVAWRRTPISR